MPGRRHLLEALNVSHRAQCEVRFVTPRGLRETNFADLWSLSATMARSVQVNLPAGRVAGVLTPSAPTVACFVGCMRAGRDFVSLPLPGRAQDPLAYAAQLRTIVELANVAAVVVEAAYVDLLRSLPEALNVPIVVSEQLAESTTDAIRSDPCPGELIQFSSGTTGTPKGVRLGGDAILASVDALLNAFGIEGIPETYCGWLPLSHDMGLIGGLLGSWVACTRTRPGYRYVCLSPELFLTRPLVWMETCSAVGATITGAPTFAYHVSSRHLQRAASLDLSKLRACAVGAEVIGVDTLEKFAAAARPHGFDEKALCPAYGLAEATLAVSMVRPEDHFSTRSVSIDGQRRDYVSCGPILDCIRLEAPDICHGAGPIRVAGPAVCSGFIPERPLQREGWLDTGDLGVVADGELIVTGRSDDLLCVAGRNLFAWELERTVSDLPEIRMGNCAVVSDGCGRYVVLFERLRVDQANLQDALVGVRRTLATVAGIGPAAVGCLERGRLPKTPSGKIRRNFISANLERMRESCIAYREF
jgi:acyl-CoA synthetase (AMP-forming)/AMP-acid ligase II